MPQPPAHNPLGIPFIELQSVDSTNNYLRQLVHEKKATPGTAIFSHEQVSGKGQRNNSWTSEKGANIILSILVNPYPIPLSMQFHLSACISVAVYDFFYKHAGKETTIKWPNDLYWKDKKAGGILIENIVRGQESGVGLSTSLKTGNWKWSIIGIGININQTSFPNTVSNAISLKQITGKNFDPVIMAKESCRFIDNKFHQLIAGKYEPIYQEYLSHLYKKNKKVKLKKGNQIFEAIIKGVSPLGKLIVQHSIEEEYDFGEIEWVI